MQTLTLIIDDVLIASVTPSPTDPSNTVLTLKVPVNTLTVKESPERIQRMLGITSGLSEYFVPPGTEAEQQDTSVS